MGFVVEMRSGSELSVFNFYWEKAQVKFNTLQATIIPGDFSGNTKAHIGAKVPKQSNSSRNQ